MGYSSLRKQLVYRGSTKAPNCAGQREFFFPLTRKANKRDAPAHRFGPNLNVAKKGKSRVAPSQNYKNRDNPDDHSNAQVSALIEFEGEQSGGLGT